MPRIEWLLKSFAALSLAALTSGCATVGSSPAPVTLPHLVEYSPATQKQAADELERIRPTAPTVGRFVDDYGNLRAAIRAGASAGSP